MEIARAFAMGFGAGPDPARRGKPAPPGNELLAGRALWARDERRRPAVTGRADRGADAAASGEGQGMSVLGRAWPDSLSVVRTGLALMALGLAVFVATFAATLATA
jgi:hypothetical protein